MMKKRLKGILVCTLAMIAVGLCSCEREDVPGLNTSVTHENIAVTLTDLFGDEEHTYITAEVELTENDSVYEGTIAEIIVSGDGTGGYSWHCIGWDKKSHTQTYLIAVTSSDKCVRTIEFLDYRSVTDPMNEIADASWLFSVDTSAAELLCDTVEVHDEMLSEIRVFESAMILIPSDGVSTEALSALEATVIDQSGNEAALSANSLSAERCRFSFGILLLEEEISSDISKIVLGEKEYLLH